jgi:fused signal recognition particle receptor
MLHFLKSSFNKVKNALSKTTSALGSKLRALFGAKIDLETLEGLEQIFYEADLGIQTAALLKDKVKEIFRKNPTLTSDGLIHEIQKEVTTLLSDQPTALVSVERGPVVILVVGVNGNGKTTSVAKLAKKMMDEGKKVLVGACDTYRAAAVDQLNLWALKIGCDIVKGAPKSDPAAVAFDAITAAKARGADVVIIDTAGRLHTRQDLMQELEKVKRTIGKVHPGAPHETLLVLDATTGQNGIDQATIFHKHTPLTGLILTKLDGTAKGGIVVNIHQTLKLPVKFIGVGEGVDDLEPFNPQLFSEALF